MKIPEAQRVSDFQRLRTGTTYRITLHFFVLRSNGARVRVTRRPGRRGSRHGTRRGPVRDSLLRGTPTHDSGRGVHNTVTRNSATFRNSSVVHVGDALEGLAGLHRTRVVGVRKKRGGWGR